MNMITRLFGRAAKPPVRRPVPVPLALVAAPAGAGLPAQTAAAPDPAPISGSTREFTNRLLIVAAFAIVAAFLYMALSVLLVLFGSILLAVVLSAAANALHRRAHLSRGWALAIVVVVLMSVILVILFLFGSRLAVQGSQLYDSLPSGLKRVSGYLSGFKWGQRLIEEVQNTNLSAQGSSMLPHVLGAVGSVLSVVTDTLLVFFAGLYLAAQPDMYRRGVLSLLPKPHRRRGAEVLDALYDSLRHWLVGQLVSMAVVGALFAIALSFIGVPSPLVLGLIAALAEFVPLVGPVLATIPAMLGALTVGPSAVLWVIGAFLVIQQTESNLLVPFVQQSTVHLPPVVALFSTVVFALLFGPIGLLFAVPLVVAVMVVIEKVYVDDILGGPAEDGDLQVAGS